ncbi:MAG: imidazole glycerol phosphate synthase subunit HisF [Candidatus Hydrothermarchaeota archaeon]|nr:MAG: imidazole glycerol phosphate synthase subunit HisF [Candidatus Hydrothermarchaeota archaeon]
MLTKRIIPCLDVKDGKVVKGINFVNLRYAGEPEKLAKLYNDQGADELVFLDISASPEGRKTMLSVVEKTADQVFIPLTVGGGVSSIEDIRKVLKAGADKVAINTAAVKNPEIIKQGAEKFGSQCIVSAIDAKRVYEDNDDKIIVNTKQGKCWFEVYIYGGRKGTGIDAIAWAKKVEELGAGEILLTSMDADGTKMGFDLELTRKVSEEVNIPVIASGGAGTLEHFYEAFALGKADAALAASIFHYREYAVREIKEYLKSKGIPVRL